MSARSLVCGAALALGMGAACASQLSTFNMVFTIDQVTNSSFCSSGSGAVSFGCLQVGQSFTGFFSVDSILLSVDGTIDNAMQNVYLPFGKALYSSGPDNLTWVGSVDRHGAAAVPSLIVANGQAVDIDGDFHGSSDSNFIGMYRTELGAPANTFQAQDIVGTMASGRLRIAPVPEPGTLPLLALGLTAMFFATRRQGAKG